MATHCAICKKSGEQYKYIYVHHDGYESYMFNLLLEHYHTDELVDKLISLGDASSLSIYLDPHTDTHSFENPEPDVCVFYHRDRGEDWATTAPKIDTLENIREQFYYTYVWEGNQWHILYGKVEDLF